MITNISLSVSLEDDEAATAVVLSTMTSVFQSLAFKGIPSSIHINQIHQEERPDATQA